MPRRSREDQLTALLQKKLQAGLETAAEVHARIYQEKVSHPGRSRPGEYPGVESGAGQSSVSFGVKGLESRSGVEDRGSHLGALSQGSHPKTGESFDRKGITDAFYENAESIQQAIKAAMETTKR